MVRPKKNLGQHFLKDDAIAERIAQSLTGEGYSTVLEIGPGMGVLTRNLLNSNFNLFVVELDAESVDYLHVHYPNLSKRIIEGDFLKLDLSEFDQQVAIIGNFPYNISSQIVFKILEQVHLVPEMAGMFQKEVAERIVAEPGSKTYGILSVLTAVFFERKYLFTVEPEAFRPPPKVRSGVILLRRKENYHPDCDVAHLFRVVKAAFNQRRKTLRNALKTLNLDLSVIEPQILSQRAEQIAPADFIAITRKLQFP